MASKVFLFDKDYWLYCSDVAFKDGVWRGWVENGAWYLVYNTKTKLLESYQSAEENRLGWKPVTSQTGELTWMCDPQGHGYNEVIAIARVRYLAKEPANFEIGPDKDFALYQKLKAKYENNDNEYDLYLELREKYEDDGIPF